MSPVLNKKVQVQVLGYKYKYNYYKYSYSQVQVYGALKFTKKWSVLFYGVGV